MGNAFNYPGIGSCIIGSLSREAFMDPRNNVHDSSLVAVVESHPCVNDKQLNLVTAFSGKEYCFDDYVSGLKSLPLRDAHFVIYDNSCSESFGKTLSRLPMALGIKSWKIFRDTNVPRVANHVDDYARTHWHVASIYSLIARRGLYPTLPLTMFLEDDVEPPEGVYERLKRVLDEEPRVATAAAALSSRLDEYPIAWYFDYHTVLGGEPEATGTRRIMAAKPYGVELVGSAAMGCWLTRTKAIRQLGISAIDGDVWAVDCVWGYRVNRSGKYFALDWGAKCKHWQQKNGKKIAV